MFKILPFFVFIFSAPLGAQQTLGSVSGTVFCDHLPKAAAEVTLTNQITKQKWLVASESNGAFVLRDVPEGDYRVTAIGGYCKGEPSEVFHVSVGEAKQVPIALRTEGNNAVAPTLPKGLPGAAGVPSPPTLLPGAGVAGPTGGGGPPRGGKFTTIRIFYATDRQRANTAQPALFYGGARNEAQSGLPYDVGQCDVSIPYDHEVGELEAPVWWKFEFRPDPELHVVLLSVTPEDGGQYFSEMRQRIAGSPKRDAFVFIHGYNTTFEDAARRTAQMAYDLKFQGAPILYSWPSEGELAKYTYDENNVEWSWRHLYDFLQRLSQQSGATTIHLIAHSMGNRALTNALQRMPRSVKPLFQEVVLAAPDIDADLFKQMATDLAGKAGRITLYASSKDDALKASKAAHGEPRAGDSDRIVIVDGVDSIDASAAATDFLGHGYVFKSSILFDINNLFKQDRPPQERDKLRQESLGTFLYWLLTP